MRRVTIGFAALIFATAPAGLLALEFGIGARAWESTLSGDVQVDASSIAGTDIDLEDDLNLDDRETVEEFNLWFKILNSRITASYVELENEGTQTLAKDITFDGITFSVSDSVTTTHDIVLADVSLESPLPLMDLDFSTVESGVTVNWILGAKYLGFKGEIEAVGQRASEDFATPIPQVGASVRGRVGGMLDLFAVAKGLTFDYSGSHGTMIDGEAGIALRWRKFGITGGYRMFQLNVDNDDAEVELDYQGPFVGAFLLF